MGNMPLNIFAVSFDPSMSVQQRACLLHLQRQLHKLQRNSYLSLHAGEKDTLKKLLLEIGPHRWDYLFGMEVVKHDNFAPNNHVYEVFSDGHVLSTKGSWAYLQRSIFDIVSGHKTKKCKDNTLLFRNVFSDGTTFMRTYNDILACAIGECILEMIQDDRIESVIKMRFSR